MGSSGGKSKGPPPAVKKLLGLFGSQREEDRMVGYLSFLKLGPKLLKFLPGQPSFYCYSVLENSFLHSLSRFTVIVIQ